MSIVMATLVADQPPFRAGERYAMPDAMARQLIADGLARDIGSFPPGGPDPQPAKVAGTYRRKG